MANEFKGKVALITGAGHGLGLSHALYLAERGARLIVNDLGGDILGMDENCDEGTAERAAAQIRDAGGEALSNQGSVADPSTTEAMVALAIENWGRVDIVVNNAGIASAQRFPNVELEEMQRHVGVSLLGCLNSARAAWPYMVEQKSGRIVNTGSAACFGNEIASYASTKAGLFGLTRAGAILGREHNININLLLPAAFSRLTDFLPESDFKTHFKAEFSPESVSPLVGYLCSERCEVTGEAFSAGAGRFSRVVYAASPAVDIDTEMDSVEQGMAEVLAATDLEIFSKTHDALLNLGFPEDIPRYG